MVVTRFRWSLTTAPISATSPWKPERFSPISGQLADHPWMWGRNTSVILATIFNESTQWTKDFQFYEYVCILILRYPCDYTIVHTCSIITAITRASEALIIYNRNEIRLSMFELSRHVLYNEQMTSSETRNPRSQRNKCRYKVNYCTTQPSWHQQRERHAMLQIFD